MRSEVGRGAGSEALRPAGLSLVVTVIVPDPKCNAEMHKQVYTGVWWGGAGPLP